MKSITKRLVSVSPEPEIVTPKKRKIKHSIVTATDSLMNEDIYEDEVINVMSNKENGAPNVAPIIISDDSNDKDSFLNDDSVSETRKRGKKLKVLTDEEIKARKEAQMSYLKTFVNISLKYSQFLEKKISTSEPSGSASTKSPKLLKKGIVDSERPDILDRLKYFEGELRPYQIEGVTWLTVLFENSVNGILADEMGLGKTIQIIALFCHLYERKVEGPFLIVAPLSTLGNWESEFKRFAPKIPVVRLQGYAQERENQKIKIKRGNFKIDGKAVKPVVLCSYQIPLLESTFLYQFNWQYIVVDEGHRIKNVESRLSKELRSLSCVNRTLLTGTPLQNEIKELWALFNFLMPELFKDIEGFSTLLELEDMQDKNQLLENEAQTKVISTIHKVLAPFMLRREKKSVLNDLVPKKEVIIYCSLTEMQAYLYRATLQEDKDKLLMRETTSEMATSSKQRRCKKKINYSYKEKEYEEGVVYVDLRMSNQQNQIPSAHKPSVCYKPKLPFRCPDRPYLCTLTLSNIFMMLQKIVNHPYLVWCPLPDENKREMFISEDLIKQSGKLLVLDTLLPKLKARGHKVLVFSTLVMFMDIIEEMLIMRNHGYARLDGHTSYDVRNENINKFMTNPDVFVFLLSTRAGGLGLNLTAADTVIFMDRDWNPMVDIQAQDRVHRIGQTKPVMVYSLITKGTIDEIRLDRGDMKKRLERVVLQEGRFKTMKKFFDENDIKELQELLNKEEKLKTVHANGLRYTNKELEDILDRSELYRQMEKLNKF